VPHTKYIGK